MFSKQILRLIENKLKIGESPFEIAAYLSICICKREMPPNSNIENLTKNIESIKNFLDAKTTGE